MQTPLISGYPLHHQVCTKQNNRKIYKAEACPERSKLQFYIDFNIIKLNNL